MQTVPLLVLFKLALHFNFTCY